MALTNAFGLLNLESTQQDIASNSWKTLNVLESLLSRQGFFDPTNGSQRVTVANTPAVTVSSGTVTTVSTVTSVTAVASVTASTVNNTNRHATDYDQYAQMNVTAQNLRNFIVST